LTALNDALRAVMIDGARLSAVGGQLGVLGLWGLIAFAVALRLFRWQ
jgi:ABC-type multidrug transport system permease subunit